MATLNLIHNKTLIFWRTQLYSLQTECYTPEQKQKKIKEKKKVDNGKPVRETDWISTKNKIELKT